MKPGYRAAFVQEIDDAVEKDGGGALVVSVRLGLSVLGLFLVSRSIAYVPLLPLIVALIVLATRPVHRLAVWWMLRSKAAYLRDYYRIAKPQCERASGSWKAWRWGLIGAGVSVLLGLGYAAHIGQWEPGLRLAVAAILVLAWARRRFAPVYREVEVAGFWFPHDERPAGQEPPPPAGADVGDYSWQRLLSGQPAVTRRLARAELAEDPEDVRMLVQFALASLATGDREEALAAALQLRELEPDTDRTEAISWVALAANGRRAEIPGLAQASALAPEDWAEWLNRCGVILRCAGASEEARLAEQLLLELAPDTAEGHALAGREALKKRRPRQAETAYRQALELEPESASYATELGRSLAAQGRLPSAWLLWLQALRAAPNRGASLLLLKATARRSVMGASALLALIIGALALAPTLAGTTPNYWMPLAAWFGALPIAAIILPSQFLVLKASAPFLLKDEDLQLRPTATDILAAATPCLLLMHALQAWLETLLHPALLSIRWQAAALATLAALIAVDLALPWLRERLAGPDP